jgi:hypothetical protein
MDKADALEGKGDGAIDLENENADRASNASFEKISGSKKM